MYYQRGKFDVIAQQTDGKPYRIASFDHAGGINHRNPKRAGERRRQIADRRDRQSHLPGVKPSRLDRTIVDPDLGLRRLAMAAKEQAAARVAADHADGYGMGARRRCRNRDRRSDQEANSSKKARHRR